MKIRLLALIVVIVLFTVSARAQVAISAGTYTQNFSSLASSGSGNSWMDNTTLPGWYASKTIGGTTVTTYNAGPGSANTGALYSFGVAGVSNLTDRALGSVASGTPGNFTYGVRFINDTGLAQTNITISYVGEQWRSGTATTEQPLTFSYAVSSAPITNSFSAATWIAFPTLDFISPNLSAASSAVDGNAVTNRHAFANVTLGVSVLPGQELMLRWSDNNDMGEDNGLAIDDLVVVFNNGSNPPAVPFILTQPTNQTVTAGGSVTFAVLAIGNPTPSYQWQFNGADLPGETSFSLALNNVTTNQSGQYRVVITNSVGTTNSVAATLTVTPATFAETLSILTYNVKGNGATNWSTNAPQIQAIARQLQYLQPDIITFNEIPKDYRYEMTNFVTAYLPGYHVVVSDSDDFFICNAIASRYAITRATSWLDGADLKPFGYTNTSTTVADNFTRDLFEAEIAAPGFPQPLHVLTTHLKATESAMDYATNAAKRAAEAAAITNFLTTNLFIPHPLHPYVLTGDMNASDTNELAVQRLVSPATGLVLTSPRNPVTSSINTYSTEFANPNSRLDYILPSQLLFSNIRTSQVFRTDRLTPLPPNLNSNDCKVASDHLPVLMVFNNPYDKPFKLLGITRTNPTVTLRWESIPGQPYRVETSTNLENWFALSANLLANGTNYLFSTNLTDAVRWFRVNRIP